ncbi:MAG: cystathionine gamma-synthase [Lentisphaerae bacterium GWF2_52_8]|nr:MAG: cystathionine gamma-synthase [Lentisphaerae bacterium GWF2_52_8]
MPRKLETMLAQAGSKWDSKTGALSMPIYQCASFRHPGLGQSTGFDYSRTSNPTRLTLENTLAELDGGAKAFAFGSGLAAIDAVLRLFAPGDKLVVTEDLYGGTFRLIEKLHKPHGVSAIYLDSSNQDSLENALKTPGVRGLFLEIPTNPLLKVADLAAASRAAKQHGVLVIVDNTFLTPALFRPIDHGADIVIYSATKYLNGHDDLVAGIAVAKDAAIGEKIAFIQNAAGAVLGPQDSWLLLRGLKTLSVRLERQEKNANVIAGRLKEHPRVRKVNYPGLPDDPGHATLKRQGAGFGAMISFELDNAAALPSILSSVQVFLFAESLGGVNSLITYPAVQTHADIGPEIRAKLGINERLLRLSIGIENVEELWNDLNRALAASPA